MDVEDYMYLVGDNTGPLTESYNLDKGWLPVILCNMAYKHNDKVYGSL